MRHAFAFGSTALAVIAFVVLSVLAPAAVLAAPPAQEATPAPATTEEAGTTPAPEAATTPTPTAAPDMGVAPAIDPNVPIPATGTELAAAPIGMLGAIGLFILLVIGVAWLLAWEQRQQ
jgi:hypothetical protein